ncbi:MAG: hypothetical protein FJ096_16100 [Deltaproteobacteria bacterium]|nr:hypothetical protein [Deltaproteobacteria bacterium]
MPLGRGYTVEEQRTGKARVGGITLTAYPLRAAVVFRERVEAACLGESSTSCGPSSRVRCHRAR